MHKNAPKVKNKVDANSWPELFLLVRTVTVPEQQLEMVVNFS